MTEQSIKRGFPPRRPQESAISENKEIGKVEQQLLACIIRDPKLINEIPRLQSIDFTDSNNASINESLQLLFNQNENSVSFLTLAASMELSGKSTANISALESLIVDSSLITKYADLIVEGSRYRQVKAAASLLASEPENKPYAKTLASALEIGFGQKTVSSSDDSMNLFFTELEKKSMGESPPADTGLSDLDEKLDGGFYGSELIVLAARPGVGKTALALGIAEHVASNQNTEKRALFISLEMSNYQLMSRRITAASRGRVPLSALRKGVISKEVHREILDAKEILSSSRLDLVASHSLDIDGLIDTVKVQAKRGELGLVVIDYLQLITPGKGASEFREQQVSEICRKLKQLANTLNISIILLSQLNRGSENGGGSKRPKLVNLRESGSIEQDADTVIFIYKEESQKRAKGANGGQVVTIIIEKQRQGENEVDVNVIWYGSECRFASIGESNSSNIKPAKSKKATPEIHTDEEIIILGKIKEMNDNIALMNGDMTDASDEIKARYAAYQHESEVAVVNDPYSQY